MYTIYLLESFNNYYNRRIIRYETLNGYLTHQTDNEKLYVSFDANFIPNDGVATEMIVNAQKINMDWNPDYVLVVDSDNTIFQRWFVIDSVRTTMGQYRLSLKRDSVVDYYYEAINAPCLVEKATLSDDNPLIYNPENFVVNQIKQSETFLKDKSQSAWIVGYLSNGDLDMGILDGGVPKPDATNPAYYEFDIIPEDVGAEYTTVSNFYQTVGIPKGFCSINGSLPIASFTSATDIENTAATDIFFQTNFEIDTFINNKSVALVLNKNGEFTNALSDKITFDSKIETGVYYIKHGRQNWEIKEDVLKQNLIPGMKGNKSTIATAFNSAWGYIAEDIISNTFNVIDITENFLKSLSGSKYYDSSTGEKIYVKDYSTISDKAYLKITDANAISKLKDLFVGNDSPFKDYFTFPNPKNDVFYIGVNVKRFFLNLEVDVSSKYRYSLPADIRTVDDNPYRMFCMPFNETIFLYTKDGTANNYFNRTNPSVSFKIAMDISKKLTGAGWLTDLQILPYCPVESWLTQGNITENGITTKVWRFDFTSEGTNDRFLKNADYTFVHMIDGDTVKNPSNIIIFPRSSTSSIKIDCPIPVVDKKVENQCNFQRLCSPNYASSFQFNAVKNNGVDYFTVNMTCRPWNPFIQVYPNFKELYGSDFNDNRGLILAGDFSLPQVNDAWNTYELNNKNYQATFDRTIQNMEKTHKLNMIEQGTGSVAGIAGGAATGAAAGALIGTAIMPGVGTAVGAAIGAGIGGGLGLVGGAADMALSQYRHNETIDYTKDQFGYNLQNIQALPNTITKTSALTANHKLFPFIEFYSCTDKEKEAFRNKLKWNGMTVGVISDIGISPYIQEEESYIKAQIININIPDDAHIAQDIARELYQGVRIKQ